MKYWDFSKYEYYALIGADTEEKALEEYQRTVASIGCGDGGLKPTIVTEEYARDLFCKCMVKQGEEDKTFDEFVKEFDEYKKSGESITILIDSGL
ncbi:hypothetical protein [Clostridium sp. LP20]|uniref:hypothetical protein n=1 Tax=Clostridium sp. LP20 TaxID=3418665 RepID=UPI003EE67272